MDELPVWLQALLTFFREVGRFLLLVLAVIGPYLLWFLFCLRAINWKRMWPTLREGAWVPLTLLLILVALVWSQIRPSSIVLFGVIGVGNFWWQLLAAGLLAAVGLFAGWVQEHFGWTPTEIPIGPPAHAHDHGHGHAHHDGHGHDRPPDDPMRKHTASHDRGIDRGGEA